MQALLRAAHGRCTGPLRSHLRGQGSTPAKEPAPGSAAAPDCSLLKQGGAHGVCGACRSCCETCIKRDGSRTPGRLSRLRRQRRNQRRLPRASRTSSALQR